MECIQVCEFCDQVRTNHPAPMEWSKFVWESGESFATVPLVRVKGCFFLVRPNQFTGVPLVTC